MHSLSIIKRLNKDQQDRFDGKEVKEVKPDIQKKTTSRTKFLTELYKMQSLFNVPMEQKGRD